MATSKSFDEFAQRIRVIAEGTTKNVEATVRKAALAVDQVAVVETPVDTGRLRAGWLVSIGSEVDGEGVFRGPEGAREQNEGPAQAEALAQGNAAIAKFKLDAGSIFVQNNVAYAGIIDAGGSQQSPEGMTAKALQAGAEIIRKARVLPE